MSVIREVTAASLTDAWRTINIDALQEDSSVNFDTSTLHPPLPEVGEADVRALAGQVRQLLRGGDSEGALRGCLEFPVYNGAETAKVRFVRLLRMFMGKIRGDGSSVLDNRVSCHRRGHCFDGPQRWPKIGRRSL